MRLTITILSLVLLSVSSWAGTFKDDFEDGNWQGWEIGAGPELDTVEKERFSIVNGVLRIDARMDIMDVADYEIGINLVRNWKNYSFSADMRVVDPDPGK